MSLRQAYYAQEWGIRIRNICQQNIQSPNLYMCKFCLLSVFWRYFDWINYQNKQSLYYYERKFSWGSKNPSYDKHEWLYCDHQERFPVVFKGVNIRSASMKATWCCSTEILFVKRCQSQFKMPCLKRLEFLKHFIGMPNFWHSVKVK